MGEGGEVVQHASSWWVEDAGDVSVGAQRFTLLS